MPDIKIKKLNEVYLQLECERSIHQELYNHFTFFAPNHQHHPKVKARLWDGRIHLYNGGKLYKGLYEALLEYAKKRLFSIETDYVPANLPLSREEVQAIYDRFDPIREAWDSQIDAIHHALTKKNLLVLSPTSSGKSLIAYYLSIVLKRIGPVLIVVPNINLVKQLYKDFIEYSANNNLPIEDLVHIIHGGKDKFTDKPITISTWQSIYELDPSYFEKFKVVIGDECHLFKAKSLRTIMESATNAEYRVGMTGSLDGKEVNEITLTGLFGPPVRVTTTHEMIKEGKATPLSVQIILFKHEDVKHKMMPKDKPYNVQRDWLVGNKKRNDKIIDIVSSQKGNKLVLFELVDKHGVPLYNLFKNKFPEKEIYFISGDISVNEREKIRALLDKTDDAILVASYGTYSTGMNVPSIQHVFSTHPGKSQVRILQSIGRALRLREGKQQAMFWDFADEFLWNGKINIGYKHFEERINLYLSERYKIETTVVELR